jgi:hypothetical protein
MMVRLPNETGWNVPRLDGRVMNRIELKGKRREGKIDKKYNNKIRFSFLF